jgi:hypothetical protein
MSGKSYPPYQCQMCGATIGYVGRAIQFAIGCRLFSGCSGTSFQKTLMSLPTTRWWWAMMMLLLAGTTIVVAFG